MSTKGAPAPDAVEPQPKPQRDEHGVAWCSEYECQLWHPAGHCRADEYKWRRNATQRGNGICEPGARADAARLKELEAMAKRVAAIDHYIASIACRSNAAVITKWLLTGTPNDDGEKSS